MRAIFLADAHLVSPSDNNYRQLLNFLQELEGNLDTLYIMGDLFDFWLGFPSHPFRQFDPVLEALERLVAHGCRLVYFEGNHDFHLGPIFSERLQAEIHSAPAIVTVQTKRLFLCHGDQINPHDHAYHLLRFLLRTGLVAKAVRYLPASWALRIKTRLQRHSQGSYHKKTARWDYRQIILGFAASEQCQGCDGLVTGHFHIAFQEKNNHDSFTVLSLGDWMGQLTYGEMLDGELRLKSYEPPENPN
jgi:UDP-2,3-diacylglucosamine hydrolase